MYTLGDFITTTDSTSGIKSLEVFYDTIILNLRAYDETTSSYYEHIIIDKLNWDYDTQEYTSDAIGIVLDIGITSETTYAGNIYIGSTLIEKTKSVLLFCLEKTDTSFIIKVYQYDINRHIIKQIYPTSASQNDWDNSNFGSLSETQPPIILRSGRNIEILVSTTSTIHIFHFTINSTLTLDNVTFLSQDYPNSIIIGGYRNTLNELVLWVNNDSQIIPLKIGDK